MKKIRKYGLIGTDLDHSFSYAYFDRKFSSLGISAQYNNYALNSIAEVVNLMDFGMDGLNITLPYKEAVIPFLHYIDKEALEVGAVNTIAVHQGSLLGYNTDIIGFRESMIALEKSTKKRIRNALILGSGGASKAIQFVLKKMACSTLVVSRSKGDLNYAEIDKKSIQNADIIINTTPLGSGKFIGLYPDIPFEYINDKHLIYDLIYNPKKSVFLAKSESNGARIVNGLEMLELQAEASWKIWNSKSINFNNYHRISK